MGVPAKLSLIFLLFTVAISLAGPLLLPYDPLRIDLDSLREPPSLKHLLGTDNKGRDILARILYGGRISLLIATSAAVSALAIGFSVGLISGYFRGWIDTIFMSIVDLFLAFPSLLLAIGISVILTPGHYTVLIALSAVGWTSFARVIRGQVLTLKNMPFVESAVAAGCGHIRIMLIHILPHCVSLSLVMLGLRLGGFILGEAALSFLGLGAQPPTPTWGSMISAHRIFISSAPWMVLAPGLVITATALSFYVLGDEIRDMYDRSRTVLMVKGTERPDF